MKRVALCFLLLSCVTISIGQNRRNSPDLSGTWRLVQSAQVRNDRTASAADTLVIVQRDPEIRMTLQTVVRGRRSRIEHIYFSDNRGETNRAQNQSITSRTRWRNGDLEIRRSHTVSFGIPGGGTRTVSMEVNERWELSSDGRTLTQIISTRLPRGMALRDRSGEETPMRNVFSRVD